MTAAVRKDLIYLDYAATSPVDPEVSNAMMMCLTADGDFANPSSDHAAGGAAKRLIEDARRSVAALVGAAAERLIFTSGATEANNIALKGSFPAGSTRQSHMVTTRIEHRSVLDVAHWLAREGVDLTLVECDSVGHVSPQKIAAAIRDDTRLVSVMHVNNEIGTIQDIAEIAVVCHERGVPLHVDAAQSAGKVPLAIADSGIDLCSLTAHKVNGPKGVGALYIRPGLELQPLLHGGEQELGLRAGTLPTHQIVGMGKAYELADVVGEGPRLAGMRELLWEGLSTIDNIMRNSPFERSAPHILNVSIPGIDGESLRFALRDIAVSAGSACSSDSPDASHVLSALGLSNTLAQSALRFGVGRFTTESQIAAAIDRVRTETARLRRLAAGAPVWCST